LSPTTPETPLGALAEARQRHDELARVNAELRAANDSVTALYTQLSGELEETNRGVVALYAELDEKTAQLHAASEAKSRFLANVSHELRAPVTAIIGLSRLLADSDSDPLTAEQERQVALIRSSATGLLGLVNDLLDLAKAEAGGIEPAWAEVDLRAIFSQLHGTLRAVHRQPGVELDVADPRPPRPLHCDEVLLTQILRNLLSNALKFTERGHVRLRDRWPDGGDTVEFEVSDTGIGIPEELHERIFEEFYQVPGPMQTRVAGTGLGLPYARRLAELLGGSLRMTSTPGKGSVFVLTLPTEAKR
jgi:signal transduction histidine kinase